MPTATGVQFPETWAHSTERTLAYVLLRPARTSAHSDSSANRVGKMKSNGRVGNFTVKIQASKISQAFFTLHYSTDPSTSWIRGSALADCFVTRQDMREVR